MRYLDFMTGLRSAMWVELRLNNQKKLPRLFYAKISMYTDNHISKMIIFML